MAQEPLTLQAAIVYFSDADRCREYVVSRRWPEGVTCPQCGSTAVKFQPRYNRWQCASHHARRQFTVKTGTIFEDSPLSMDKWMCAMWMVVNCKNGVSSYEIHRAIGVTQKTAWFMLSRLRLVLQDKRGGGKLSGEVEVDETYIGGKARFMHKDRKARTIKASSKTAGKVAVMGLLERHGKRGHSTIKTTIVPNARKSGLQARVRANVEPGSSVYTDALRSYIGLDADYIHGVIDHAEAYVDGQVHTNGCENFWSLLKRSIKGTYVSVEPFHLFRYLDEQAFRFNNRTLTDGERFSMALSSVAGLRLTFTELIGRTNPAEAVN